MYCRNCGFELPDDSKFCPECGVAITEVPTRSQGEKPLPAQGVNNDPITNQNQSDMICPHCGGSMVMQTVSESRKAGCLTVLFYILLACTILGLLIVIPLALRRKTDTVTYAVCQHCGYRKKVS